MAKGCEEYVKIILGQAHRTEFVVEVFLKRASHESNVHFELNKISNEGVDPFAPPSLSLTAWFLCLPGQVFKKDDNKYAAVFNNCAI